MAVFNELTGLGSHAGNQAAVGRELLPWLQDNAASTVVVDSSGHGRNGTLNGGDNTAAKTVSGPTLWLPSALQFNGSDDYISVPGTSLGSFGNAFTFCAWIWVDSAASNSVLFGQSNTNNAWHIELRTADNSIGIFEPGTNVAVAAAGVFNDEEWFHLVYTRLGTGSGTHVFYVNGLLVSTATDGSANFTNSTSTKQIGQRGDGTQFFRGRAAGLGLFVGAVSGGEALQLARGPQPVTASAQELAGTAQQGETLTATPAGWGLPSPLNGGTNGDITNGFRWTRSDDDSGTNEADIAGATSSTYTQVEADVGKYLRCWISGTNDGGNDPAADTATPFTGVVTAAAVAGRTRLLKGVG